MRIDVANALDTGISASLYITLLLDASGSMTDEGGIASTTDFQRRLVQGLLGTPRREDSKVMIRSLVYSDESRWLEDAPVKLEDFDIPTIPMGQFSHFGGALEVALAEHREASAAERVVWLWIGDGYVTDDWLPQVEQLRTDPAYQRIERWAVHPVGSVNLAALQWFAGEKDRVHPAASADPILESLKSGSTSPTSDDWDEDVF